MDTDARTIRPGLLLQRYGTMLGLIMICAIFAVLRPDAFATPANLLNVTQQMATLAFVAAAATFVMVVGEFDLSVGAVAAWAGIAVVCLLGMGVGVVPAVLLALASYALLGAATVPLVAARPDESRVGKRCV